MEDKSALLRQLRIDRSPEPVSTARGRIWALVVLILLAAAGAAWAFLWPRGVPIRVVTAQAIAGDTGGSVSQSILDASGYVVARRAATVASKITARMVTLDIEEGDHVKANQIIATLDDTNIRASWRATM